MLCTKILFKYNDLSRLKVKHRKRYVTQTLIKKAEVAIFVSDKVDFRTEKFTRDKEECFIIIKGSIQEEILNL